MKYNIKLILSGIIMMLSLASCQTDSAVNQSIGQTPTSGVGGSLARFATVGNYLYVVQSTSMEVFRIDENSKTQKVRSLNIDHIVETIFPRDNNTLFIGTMSGMLIYDISQKDNPKLLSTYEHVIACDPVVANQNYAYVTLRSIPGAGRWCNWSVNQLEVIDISDLRNPYLVGALSLSSPIGLGLISSDTLLVCDNDIKIINVSNPEAPKVIGEIPMDNPLDLIPLQKSIIVLSPKKIRQYDYHNGTFTYLSTIE